jgi:hypothetical protein
LATKIISSGLFCLHSGIVLKWSVHYLLGVDLGWNGSQK